MSFNKLVRRRRFRSRVKQDIDDAMDAIGTKPLGMALSVALAEALDAAERMESAARHLRAVAQRQTCES